MDEKKINWKEELLDLGKTFVICLFIVFLLTHFVAKPVRVDGVSMYPTLKDGEIGFINMFAKKTQGVERYDVVVVNHEADHENWVKRVIGLPGETILCRDDVVYIDGKPLAEPYLNTSYVAEQRYAGHKFTLDFGPVVLGEDQYFVMGDNRVKSYDSRQLDVGAFSVEDIVGKDVYVIYPFNEIKMVRNGK